MAIQSAGKKIGDRNLSDWTPDCDFYRHSILDRKIDWLKGKKSNLITNKKMYKPLCIKWAIHNLVVE